MARVVPPALVAGEVELQVPVRLRSGQALPSALQFHGAAAGGMTTLGRRVSGHLLVECRRVLSPIHF
jgi:hypothetical protein